MDSRTEPKFTVESWPILTRKLSSSLVFLLLLKVDVLLVFSLDVAAIMLLLRP